MNEIHPTAIIGRHVRLGEGNTIGPFAVIGGRVSIGNDNWIGAGARIGAPPEVRGFVHRPDWIESDDAVGVTIGDDNVIREDVQIHSGWKSATRLGNGLFIMNQCYVAHDCELSDEVTLASGVALGGHVQLGARANLGLGTTVHQRRVIGALAMIGMSSVVTKDLPPFVKAFGSPAKIQGTNVVGMERSGMEAQTVRAIDGLAMTAGFLANAISLSSETAAAIEWFEKAQAR